MLPNSRRLLVLALVVLLVLSAVVQESAQAGTPESPPEARASGLSPVALTDLTIEQREALEAAADRIRKRMSDSEARAAESGRLIQVSIHLDKPALDRGHYRSIQRSVASRAELFEATFRSLRDADSAGVKAVVERLGGRFHAEIRFLDSAILAEIPAHALAQIEAHPHVRQISQLFDMELNLAETVPFIGAGPEGLAGVTGAGVKVGVLDSGIDYTHAAFGGPGTTAGYQAAYFGGEGNTCPDPDDASTCHHTLDPQTIGQADFFGPDATDTNIRGGFDFVGEAWPNGPLSPNPNPIDFQGHGTNVADIIGGLQGVAPGVELYAYKVCSAVSGSCSGIAIVMGLEQALLDEVDIVNLSLGAPWGQPVNSDSHLLDLLAVEGILGVASAGNSGDQPFVVGAPSSATAALSVAQSNLPSSFIPTLRIVNGTEPNDPLNTREAVWQTWSTAPADLDLPLIYGADNNILGCDPFETPLTDLVVLVYRGGDCAISIKAANASAAGAAAVLIAMNDDSPPFAFSDGGGDVEIPAYVISRAVGDNIASRLNSFLSPRLIVDLEAFIDASRGIASTTSRGPRNHDNRLKPEIAAPGASLSALAGSGTGRRVFGGTSGAAPMVAGAAALLIEHFNIKNSKGFGPLEIKTLLMNHADPELYVSVPDGILAPISRIGAGLIQIAGAADWKLMVQDITESDPLTHTGAISLGYRTPGQTEIVNRTLQVTNISAAAVTVTPEATFRFTNDQGAGVSVSLSPPSASIEPGAGQTFTASFTIDPAQLFLAKSPTEFPRRGQQGNTSGGLVLTHYEFDGYVVFRENGEARASVPWHLLPRPASLVALDGSSVDGGTISHTFSNTAMVPAENDVFRLFEENPSWGLIAGDCGSLELEPGCDRDGIDLKHIGFGDDANDLLSFAASLYDPPFRAGALPVSLEFYIDVNRDGIADFVVFNLQDNTFGNIVARVNLATDQFQADFFTDSRFNSNVFVLTTLRPESLQVGDLFDFWVAAKNGYHGGYYDCAPHVPNLERPIPLDNTDVCRSQGVFTARYGKPALVGDPFADMSAGGSVSINHRISSSGSNELGLLLLNGWGPIGHESLAIPVDFRALDPIFLDRFQVSPPSQ